ncbi:hypothetical protein K493DRAFT_33000 [Basidiobolus meristosporus CBS 931.73]|uniref:HTH APSES-type domain-containing protein n=1 Tax=Basidiobolus meristosporus CBS 931.73 TaxID=1314790 RepID=A0A1Y1Y8A5_9FUNG|nr:hypothetical protein K493DRAFT_33000 [Basidiobolus meristosporus CBS 931.73]|eukprot:ORX93966.1 hypothetical protein K493DRAFT_33000 [Basidiobolus meristosporus CBS 931.73]
MTECSINQLEDSNIQSLTHNSGEFWDSQKHSSKTPLPYSLENIHPDDAKDKVFAAILKALVVMDNKPSSPKELANCIMKHKFTILGGATPYATVSSRISQHFKRAAEHKPPRPPLLARVVDEVHSRKIHYYIAGGSVPQSKRSDPVCSPQKAPASLKETNAVQGGYPKLRIRLKRRKKANERTAHVMKKQKAVLSGTRPGMGKGKWVPRTEPANCIKSYSAGSSEDGSDADIDAIGPDSEQEFEGDIARSHPASGKRGMSYHSELSSHGTQTGSISVDAYDATTSMLGLTSDAEYSDYFEEMMNGDLCIDDDSPIVKLEPDSASSPLFHRSQLDSVNSPTYDLGTSTSSTVTPDPPVHKEVGVDLAPGTNLLTPDTTSLFERELDTHLIPSFGDEFNEDSPLLSKNVSYVPLMELNNPETMPVSELDELLNGSPRTHDSSPKRLFGSRDKGMTKRTPNHEFSRFEENHDHKVPSREDEIADGELASFNVKSDVVGMDLDSRSSDGSPNLSQDGSFGTMSVDSERTPVHEDSTTQATSMEGTELLNESNPVLIDAEAKAPMVVVKVYSNVSVYETVLPDTQLRLLRFKSNVPVEDSNSRHKKSMVMLEEDRHKDFCNASLLRKAAQPYVGDGKLESDDGNTRFVVIRNGPAECRGVWVSLDRARHLVEEYGMQNVPHIQKLLSDAPLDQRYDFSESSMDPSEIDKHLVELSGILQNAVSEYSLSQKNRTTPKSACNSNHDENTFSEPHIEKESMESANPSHMGDIDPHAFISLDEDDEDQSHMQCHEDAKTCDSSPSSTASGGEGDSEALEDITDERKAFITTQSPTTPTIYLTVIESVPVYVTYISKGAGSNETFQLMRRFDSGYVNGTKLLMAGGVETESERTIVLSLEVGRVRIRKPESKLFGTWIPLPRARALASTCSLQHKLGPFLDNNLPSYFSTPLPSSITTARPMRLTSRLHQVFRAPSNLRVQL